MPKLTRANVAFTGSTGGLGGAIDNAERRIKRFEQSAQRTNRRLRTLSGGIFGGLLGAGGAISATAALRSLSQMSDAIDRTQKAAQRLNVDTGTVRAFERIAEFNGASSEQGVRAIERMMKSIGDAKFSPAVARAFEALGTSADSIGQLGTDSAYLRILERLRDAPSSEQASLAALIFGRDGARVVLNQLRSTNEELARMLRLIRDGSPATGLANEVATANDRAAGFRGGLSDALQSLYGASSAIANQATGSPAAFYEAGNEGVFRLLDPTGSLRNINRAAQAGDALDRIAENTAEMGPR